MKASSRFGLRRADEIQLAAIGIPLEEAERQLELLQSPPSPIHLERPCTVGDGILQVDPSQDKSLLDAWQVAAGAGRLSKFVPASGAASRMFDAAARVRESGAASRDELMERREAGDRIAGEVLELIDRASGLPFFSALASVLPGGSREIGAAQTAEEIATVLEALLGPRGLGYASLAKGLIPFHRYPAESRSAFEEHLIEGAAYLADRDGVARFHFTVPAAQQTEFEMAVGPLQERHGLDLDVSFSVQDHATDTLGLDLTGAVARKSDGSLVLRPGGHGALLPNLEQAAGDIVFLKNIDNVVPEPRQREVVLWQKRLGSLLVELEQKSRELQAGLSGPDWTDALDPAQRFCRDRLSWTPDANTPEERRTQVRQRLDRPLRVCGMVRNEGEPGGGPFWVRHNSGALSRQIVESAQVDHGDPQQASMWGSSTHFNPVLLVASLRDRDDRPYRLRRFVDQEAVFVSQKPIDRGTARVLEHPGLWNGAMAHWNTVFVEVPLAVFAPVKTVLDLLRAAHRTAVE